MAARAYIENFADGPGGWVGWKSNAQGPMRLEVEQQALVARSPWWIDYNHAPPGAGYLHILFGLYTTAAGHAQCLEQGGPNRFVEGRFPLRFCESLRFLFLVDR